MNQSVFSEARKKRKLFLFLFSAINFVTGALYTWSIFAGPLAVRLSGFTGTEFTAASLSGVFGLAAGITPFMMILGGFVNDRFGPKAVIGTGGALIGLGYFLMPLMQSLPGLYLAYGILVGAGTGLVNGCTINTAVKFFPEKRGFAGGTVTAALGFGAVLWPLIAGSLTESFGIVTALLSFGAVSAFVIVPFSLLTAKCPDGFSGFILNGKTAEIRTAVSASGDKNWIGMIRTPTFWPLTLLFISAAMMGLMLLSSISGIASEQIGLGAALAALSVSAVSLANTAGRFLCSTLSDAIGRIPALMLSLICALAGALLLVSAGTGDTVRFFSGICLIGLCFGAFIGIYPGLVADEYGAKHNSVNFSVMMLGYSVGGFAGPALIRWARTGTGFTRAYEVCAAAAVCGLLCAVIFLLMKRNSAKRHNAAAVSVSSRIS